MRAEETRRQRPRPPTRAFVIAIQEPEPTDFGRRALPWLASLTFLAVLLAASTVIVFDRTELPLPAEPVEVVLGGASPEQLQDDSADSDGGRLSPSSAKLALPAPGGIVEARPGRPVVPADAPPRMQPVGNPAGGAVESIPQPSAQDVLSDLPSASSPEAHSDGQFGWEQGRPRKVLSRKDPQFPPFLGAAGVEVECTARITVSPTGAVTRVEITRSSGYTEIDASVEAALREYLFSQVDGRKDEVGTVRFRFRLEKPN